MYLDLLLCKPYAIEKMMLKIEKKVVFSPITVDLWGVTVPDFEKLQITNLFFCCCCCWYLNSDKFLPWQSRGHVGKGPTLQTQSVRVQLLHEYLH